MNCPNSTVLCSRRTNVGIDAIACCAVGIANGDTPKHSERPTGQARRDRRADRRVTGPTTRGDDRPGSYRRDPANVRPGH